MQTFCYCAEARRLARLLTARYDSHLKPSGLTSAQFELLSVLHARQQMGGRDLAQWLAVDTTTLSRNLKTLTDAGTVEATRSTTDARARLYTLTGKGRRQLQQAQPLWQQAHDETEHMLGSEAETMPAALRLLTSTL